MASRQQQGVGSFGFPTFGAPQDLMPIPKITGARALSVGTPSFSERDEESASGIMLAGILGSASPGIVEFITGLLMKDLAQTKKTPGTTQLLDDVLDELEADPRLGAARPVTVGPEKTELPVELGAKVLKYRRENPTLPENKVLEAAQQELLIEKLYPTEELPAEKKWQRKGMEFVLETVMAAGASKLGPKAGAAYAAGRVATQAGKGDIRTARVKGREARRTDRQASLAKELPDIFERPDMPDLARPYAVYDLRDQPMGETMAKERLEWDPQTGSWKKITQYRLPDGKGDFDWFDADDPKNRRRQWTVKPPTQPLERPSKAKEEQITFLNEAMDRDLNLIGVMRLGIEALNIFAENPQVGTLLVRTAHNLGHRGREEWKHFTRDYSFKFSRDPEKGGGMVPLPGKRGGEGLNTDIANTGYTAQQIFNELGTLKFDSPEDLRALRSYLVQLGGAGETVAKDFFTPEEWDDTAIADAELAAVQLQLAYMAAALNGQTGRTLSDRDLEYHLRMVGFGPDMTAPRATNVITRFLQAQLKQSDDPFTYRAYAVPVTNDEGKLVFRSGPSFDMLLRKLGGPVPAGTYTWAQYEKAQEDGLNLFFQPYYLDEETKKRMPSDPSNPKIDGYRFLRVQDRIKSSLIDEKDSLNKLLKTINLRDNALPGSGGEGEERTDEELLKDVLEMLGS